MTTRTLATRIIPLLPLAATVPASAVIVYTDAAVGPADFVGLYFDFSTSTPELLAGEAFQESSLATLYLGYMIKTPYTDRSARVSASSLAAGATIDASVNWGAYTGWVSDDSRTFFGLEISHEGETYYGWAEVTNHGDDSGTVYRFAVETSANTTIRAGDTGAVIPEPSTYAAMAGLLAGSAALYARRRRSNAAA